MSILPMTFDDATNSESLAFVQATAEEQRTLWLEVGVALMYGKQKENRKPGQKFSEWVQEEFPGLRQNDAASAIWFAENSTVTVNLPAGISHPENIRQWHREQQATQVLPQNLQEVTPEDSIELPKRDAERVAKVARRAESGDEGSDIAKRHLEGLPRMVVRRCP